MCLIKQILNALLSYIHVYISISIRIIISIISSSSSSSIMGMLLLLLLLLLVVVVICYTYVYIYIYIYTHIHTYIHKCICNKCIMVSNTMLSCCVFRNLDTEILSTKTAVVNSRGRDDMVGNPRRAQTSQFELFELVPLLKLG